MVRPERAAVGFPQPGVAPAAVDVGGSISGVSRLRADFGKPSNHRLRPGAFPPGEQGLASEAGQLGPARLARVPHDAVSGRPMIYHPVGEGSFIPRGVAPNGTDDRKNKTSDD